MLLRKFTESGNIILTGEIELSFFLFVDIPENINANRIHSQCFAHLYAMTPVSLWDTGVMQLRRLHYKWVSIKQECVLARLKFVGSGLRQQKNSTKTNKKTKG